jgi:hypothetical protein
MADGFFQRTGLLFRTRHRSTVPRWISPEAAPMVCVLANIADDGGKTFVHVLQRSDQLTHFVAAVHVDATGEVTVTHFCGQSPRRAKGTAIDRVNRQAINIPTTNASALIPAIVNLACE